MDCCRSRTSLKYRRERTRPTISFCRRLTLSCCRGGVGVFRRGVFGIRGSSGKPLVGGEASSSRSSGSPSSESSPRAFLRFPGFGFLAEDLPLDFEVVEVHESLLNQKLLISRDTTSFKALLQHLHRTNGVTTIMPWRAANFPEGVEFLHCSLLLLDFLQILPLNCRTVVDTQMNPKEDRNSLHIRKIIEGRRTGKSPFIGTSNRLRYTHRQRAY
ncbi:hypothetical protein BGX38DRAFT_129 [Terfezia claveryi]|nr:hypothetical protein BGX38DRAFT_129 [Terfezia claveryi]